MSEDINWRMVIEDLARTMPIVRIASELKVSAQSLHDLKSGKVANPRASTGFALIRLQARENARIEREDAEFHKASHP